MIIAAQLLIATAMHVAIPAFQLTRAPGPLGQRLSVSYAAALQETNCADPIASVRFSADASAAVQACHRDVRCLARVGESLNVDYVLMGSVTRVDDRFITEVQAVDVGSREIVKRFRSDYVGKLADLGDKVRETAPALCRALDPRRAGGLQLSPAEELAELSYDDGATDPGAADVDSTIDALALSFSDAPGGDHAPSRPAPVLRMPPPELFAKPSRSSAVRCSCVADYSQGAGSR